MTNDTPPTTNPQKMKQAHFIGRQDERRFFSTALVTHEQDWQIANVFGPHGIGKSSLLKAFGQMARDDGHTVISIDINEAGGSVETFLSTLADQVGIDGHTLDDCLTGIQKLIENDHRLILALDNYGDMEIFNRWLRDQFLRQLSPHCIILVASRQPLSSSWGDNPFWNRLVKPLPLSPFDFEETRAYFKNSELKDQQLLKQIWHYTNGLPVALAFIASVIDKEGPAVIREIPKRTDIIEDLAHYWHQELSENRSLWRLLEAASTVRRFNLDLLQTLTDGVVDEPLFTALTSASCILEDNFGWSVQELVRETLVRHLRNRSPSRYSEMRNKALVYFGNLATQPGHELDRSMALQELFYMLGDGFVRAALFDQQSSGGETFYTENASPADFADLEEYMAQWRHEYASANGAKVELYDREKHAIDPQWITKEPLEPELIDFKEIIRETPGAIKLLRDEEARLRGLSIVLPINKNSIGYLGQTPVTRGYINSLTAEQLDSLADSSEDTQHWFVRLIDVRDEEDNPARSALFRELTGLLARPSIFITSTPLPFYLSLLHHFGFREMDIAPHGDFGGTRPTPYFALDLRGEHFIRYIQQMISSQTGDETLRALSPQLANMLARKPSPDETKQEERERFLEPLTSREQQVARYAVEGLANCSIAAKLNVTEVTIKKHMSRIFEKLGVRNRRELIKRYWSSE